MVLERLTRPCWGRQLFPVIYTASYNDVATPIIFFFKAAEHIAEIEYTLLGLVMVPEYYTSRNTKIYTIFTTTRKMYSVLGAYN